METVKVSDGISSLQFHVHPVGTNYKEIGGVYLFLAKTTNGTWDLLYIGETSNLNERLNARLQSHQAWPCGRNKGCSHFGTRAVSGHQTRLDLETRLRHKYNTPCNRQ